VLPCVAVCCSVLQCVVIHRFSPQIEVSLEIVFMMCVAVCCSVLPCVAVCCRVLQCVAVCSSVLHCVAVRCSALQCVAVRCSVLHTSQITRIDHLVHANVCLEKISNDRLCAKKGKNNSMHTHSITRTFTRTFTHTHLHTHIHIHMHTHSLTHAHTHTCTHIYSVLTYIFGKKHMSGSPLRQKGGNNVLHTHSLTHTHIHTRANSANLHF